jgi:hypothetical protein
VRRRLLNLLTLLSLLLCVAVVAMWAASYRDRGQEWYFRPGRVTDVTPHLFGTTEAWCFQHSLHSGRGQVRWVRREVQVDQTEPPGYASPRHREGFAVAELESIQPRHVIRRVGPFEYLSRPRRPVGPEPYYQGMWYLGLRIIGAPYWSLTAATAALPVALALRRLLTTRRRNAGTCPACGYDLRATPGRCPECGEAPPPPPRSKTSSIPRFFPAFGPVRKEKLSG